MYIDTLPPPPFNPPTRKWNINSNVLIKMSLMFKKTQIPQKLLTGTEAATRSVL